MTKGFSDIHMKCLSVEISESLGNTAAHHRRPLAGRETADGPCLLFVQIVGIAIPVEVATIEEVRSPCHYMARADVDRTAHPEGRCNVDVEDVWFTRDEMKVEWLSCSIAMKENDRQPRRRLHGAALHPMIRRLQIQP
ncbi:hypothetical protein ASC90_02150 [Rhizobium sp. Root1220]|nr:hypothetical protein ASC90_02150 [Rhizobium sp. Root1220]